MKFKWPFKKKEPYSLGNLPTYTRVQVNEPKKRPVNLKVFAFILAFLLVGSAGFAGVAYFANRDQVEVSKNKADGEPLKLKTSARNALVIDAQTGQILGSKNPDQKIGIASQSKMLTAYATLQGIDDGKFEWTTPVKITKSSDWSSKDIDMYAHLDIHEGQTLTVKELFNAMFLASANDASLALADYVKNKDESQQEFLQRWAKKLDLDDSSWYNAAGQVNEDAFDYQVKSAKKTAENTATPRELAILAYRILQDYPDIRTYYEKLGLVYSPNGDTTQTKIKLAEGGKFSREIKDKLNNPKNLIFEGMKTGSTPDTGGALTGLIKDKDGHEFITVVSGAGKYTDSFERYQVTADIVGQVLDNFKNQVVNEKAKVPGQGLPKNAWAESGYSHLVAKEKRSYWMKKSEKGKLTFETVKRVNTDELDDDATVKYVGPNLKAEYLKGIQASDYKIPLTNQESEIAAEENLFLKHWLMFWK